MERWPKIKMWKYILRKKMLYGIGFVCVLIGMTVTGVCIKPAKEVQASISHEAVKDIRSDAPGGERVFLNSRRVKPRTIRMIRWTCWEICLK